VTFEDDSPLFYGSRCGKYDELRKRRKRFTIPDAFKERKRLLWDRDGKGIDTDKLIFYKAKDKQKGRIGMPRALLFWDKFPFWSEYLRSLGYEVVLSPRTDKEIVTTSVQGATALACLPSKIVHGHVKKLLEHDIDFLFLPAIINHDFEKLQTRVNQNCPLIQGMPYIANGQFNFRKLNIKVIQDAFHFYQGKKLRKELLQLGTNLSCTKSEISMAIKKAEKDQKRFEQECYTAGQKILKLVNERRKGIVIISRSYNGNDLGINLDVPGKFREMGVIPIPLDFLDLSQIDISKYTFMHWNYGKRILAATELVKKTPHLYGVYLSHFMCGPDSFIIHYFNRMLADKPHLHLELDEHSADAGIKTRCEAFLDSLSFFSSQKSSKEYQQIEKRAVLSRG
jgi:predicted nucleotide-binding protein (sugar kinase/HSP70/actin superfamily)